MSTACILDSQKDSASDTEAIGATDTEAVSETAAATEPDSDTADTDTGGAAPIPLECDAPDPAVDASFELILPEDWPDGRSDSHSLDLACVIGQVTTGPTISSELVCDVDGEQRTAILEFAAPVLDEDFLAGEPVHLLSYAQDATGLDLGVFRLLSLHSASDQRLLVYGAHFEQLELEALPGLLTPLTAELSFPCGPEDGLASDTPMQVTFALPDGGPELGLIHGHSGLLDSGLGFAYDIDVEQATTNNCCHYDRWHEVLIRRVVVDG